MGQLVVPTYWGELMVPFPSYDHPSPIGSQGTLPWLLKTEFGKGIRQRSSSARQGMGREGRGRVFQLCLPLESLGREYLNTGWIYLGSQQGSGGKLHPQIGHEPGFPRQVRTDHWPRFWQGNPSFSARP